MKATDWSVFRWIMNEWGKHGILMPWNTALSWKEGDSDTYDNMEKPKEHHAK